MSKDDKNKNIPKYYIKNGKFIGIDRYDMIIDDIRNLRKLTEEQLEFIKGLNDEKKHILFKTLYVHIIHPMSLFLF